MTKRRVLVGVPLATAAFVSAAAAQGVTIAPTALYIDDQTPHSVLVLENPGPRTEEVSIDLAFGYARSDASGNLNVVFLDSVPPEEPSAVPFVRLFPRRVVLEPGGRQFVRLLVSPPPDLPDGEYWARVLLASRAAPTGEHAAEAPARLEVRTVFAVALTYRHGEVKTGVRVHEARAEPTPTGLDLFLGLEREGNAAYLGQVEAAVLDEGGLVVASRVASIAVYRRILWRLRIPLRPPQDKVRPGWRICYRIVANRDESAPGELLSAPPVNGTIILSGGADDGVDSATADVPGWAGGIVAPQGSCSVTEGRPGRSPSPR